MKNELAYDSIDLTKINTTMDYIESRGLLFDALDIDLDGIGIVLSRYGIHNSWSGYENIILEKWLSDYELHNHETECFWFGGE